MTARWQCNCGRWALWKATLGGLGRHGLDVLGPSRGRMAIRSGMPPAAACDVLQGPHFTCLCGTCVPVAETFAALLQFGGPLLWQAPPSPSCPGPSPKA